MAESHQKMKIFKIPIIGTKMESQYCYKTEFRAFEASAVEKTHAIITKIHFFGYFFIEIHENARVVVNFETSLHINVKTFFNSVNSS